MNRSCKVRIVRENCVDICIPSPGIHQQLGREVHIATFLFGTLDLDRDDFAVSIKFLGMLWVPMLLENIGSSHDVDVLQCVQCLEVLLLALSYARVVGRRLEIGCEEVDVRDLILPVQPSDKLVDVEPLELGLGALEQPLIEREAVYVSNHLFGHDGSLMELVQRARSLIAQRGTCQRTRLTRKAVRRCAQLRSALIPRRRRNTRSLESSKQGLQ